jgi:hypothetical protein
MTDTDFIFKQIKILMTEGYFGDEIYKSFRAMHFGQHTNIKVIGDDVYYSHGSKYDGTSWIATTTASAIIKKSGGATTFYANTGLTEGVAFTPTAIITFSSTGTLNVDHIEELTATHGVSVDSVTLKDGGSLTITGGTNTFNLTNGTAVLDVAAGCTVNVDANLTITTALTNQGAAGVLSWGGAYTLTIPATGTAALLATANVFTASQTIQKDAAVALILNTTSAVPTARNFALLASQTSYGDFAIMQSNALGGNPISAGTVRFYISTSGNIGFGGTDALIGDGTYFGNLVCSKPSGAGGTGALFGIKNTNAGDTLSGTWIKSSTSNAGWFVGSNSSGNFQIRYGSGASETTAVAQAVGALSRIEISSSANIQTNYLTNATTNAADTIFTLNHRSTGTAANGFGSILRFALQSSTSYDQLAADINVAWTDATHASRTSAMGFYVVYNGAVSETMRLDGNGSVIINDSGLSTADVRMEGDTATNLFFLDASADVVEIGTTISGAIAKFYPTEITFNETGAATLDFRVEGDTLANLFFIDASADSVFINDTSNNLMTVGLTINQGANDNEIFSLKSSDVAHGATFITETDTFGFFTKYSANDGGFNLYGVSEVTVGANITGVSVTVDTTKTTSSVSSAQVLGGKVVGGALGASSDNQNIFGIQTVRGVASVQTIWLVDKESTMHVLPNGDVSFDVITVQVTGTPTFAWDETNDFFTLNKGISITGGSQYIGDTANANMTIGLTINQGANDDEILVFKSSDVAVGITDYQETDTYANMKKYSANEGGVQLGGWTENIVAIDLSGCYTNSDTTKSTSGLASTIVRSNKKNGTGFGAPTDATNIFALRCHTGASTSTTHIFDENGDITVDGSSTIATYDDYDDVGLLTGLRASLKPYGHELRERFSDWMQYAKPILEEAKIVTYNDDTDGVPFISLKGLHMLEIDAIRQLNEKINVLAKELKETKDKLYLLQGDNYA